MASTRILLGGIAVASVTVLGMSAADATLPSTATKIAVAAGDTVSAVDGHLHAAASIAGTITAGGAHPFAVVLVYLHGNLVTGAGTDGSGQYLIGGLRPS